MYFQLIHCFFSEGGRLQAELEYVSNNLGEGSGSTQQLLISTPKNPDSNILHPSAFLTHLEVLKKASSVTVDMFDM